MLPTEGEEGGQLGTGYCYNDPSKEGVLLWVVTRVTKRKKAKERKRCPTAGGLTAAGGENGYTKFALRARRGPAGEKRRERMDLLLTHIYMRKKRRKGGGGVPPHKGSGRKNPARGESRDKRKTQAKKGYREGKQIRDKGKLPFSEKEPFINKRNEIL